MARGFTNPADRMVYGVRFHPRRAFTSLMSLRCLLVGRTNVVGVVAAGLSADSHLLAFCRLGVDDDVGRRASALGLLPIPNIPAPL